MWNFNKTTNQTGQENYGWKSNSNVERRTTSTSTTVSSSSTPSGFGWNIPSPAPFTPTSPLRGPSSPLDELMDKHGNELLVEEQVFLCKEIPSSGLVYAVGDRMNSSSGYNTNQDYYALKQGCLKTGKLFEDPEFPASDFSLFYSRRPDRKYEWLRPTQITKNADFFVDGYSRFDIKQGELGDCWLLAAAANLTQNEKLFNKVVPPDNSFQKNYAGIFHFRFWQYGKWVDVVIDDRLPTYQGRLMYMRSSVQNEFWSALLEKAYAKLHGSYEALRGGTTSEAMEDFTAGVSESYDLKDAPANLFNLLEKGFLNQSMMSCSIEPNPGVFEDQTPQGLVRGHAYSITLAKYIDIATPKMKGKLPMLRLRNPWGNETEWNGAFSDGSPEWQYIPAHAKKDIGLEFKMDGEFWMTFKDFMKYLDRVEFCHLSPDLLGDEGLTSKKRNWKITTFEGEWVRGVSAGGCRNFLETFWLNPQYHITLTEPDEDDRDGYCTVVVALMQKHRRSRKHINVGCLQIGFAIYKISEKDLMEKPQRLNFFKYNATVARSPPFTNLREVSCRFKFKPGHYLIVPSTYEPNDEAEFLIRVFSESKNKLEENDDELGIGEVDNRVTKQLGDPEKPSPERSAMYDLFLDVAGEDKEVDWMELQGILGHCFRDIMQTAELSKDVCRSMVAMVDKDQSGKLDFEQFKALLNDIAMWKAVFKLFAKGRSSLKGFELRDALKSAGYHLNVKILNALVHRYGSKDGTIAADDFITCAIKVKTMIEAFREKDKFNRNEATFTLDEWISKTVYS